MSRILYLADPATFSSLVLVSHDWRAASEIPQLYAFHLSRCPSFSIKNDVITGPFDENSLPWLKRRFFQEIKRNLFDVFLRPRRTEINLISTNTNSAAACPGGETFDFAFSPNGHWTLASSSSRIYVIDTFSPNVSVRRELKVLRRPVSATILDDGSLLAVLSSDHRVNIYSLADRPLKHCRALSLDNPPNTIALSPKGEVLAAAYNGGIEVHAIVASAISRGRRDVKCDSVDSLTFSCDGTVLFGTTQNSKTPNTVVLSAPYYSETNQELPSTDILSHMWTSQILFPNNTRDCSHAALLPHHSEGDSCWAFTYDRVFESFRAVRTDDLRNGTTYFTGPKTSGKSRPRSARRKLVPCTLPATSDRGELVAAGFFGKEVWLYGVPESLDATNPAQLDEPVSRNEPVRTSSTGSSNEKSQQSPARSLTNGEDAELKALPQWQVLVDRSRNVFAKGRRVTNVPGITGVHWVSRKIPSANAYSLAQRLVIVATGGLSNRPDTLDQFAIIDGGRLVILDFDRTEENGKCEELTIEVGNVPPEILEEEHIDMETEIALVRQRTVRQRRDGKIGTSVAEMLASAPDHLLQPPPIPPLPATASAVIGETSATSGNSSSIGRPAQENASAEGISLEEASADFDGPYTHDHPRSRSSLYRSATAVAANRQRNPPRIIVPGRAEMRRADGRGELPHESDADNWVPPPPPYTPDADRPLPEHLRLALLPRQIEPTHRAVEDMDLLRRANTMTASESHGSSSQRISSLPERSRVPFRRAQSGNSSERQIEEVVSGLRLQTPQSSRPANPSRRSHGGAASEISSVATRTSGTRTSQATPSRRPVSAHADRHTDSSPRSLRGRIVGLTSPVAGSRAGGGLAHAKSASLPSSPTNNRSVPPPLPLSGLDPQRRLESPLPATPSAHGPGMCPPSSPTQPPQPSTTAIAPVQEVERITTGMPSAQQLANLHNRYRSPPPGAANGQSRTVSATIGQSNGGPPRAALGAAGTLSSPVAERRRSALAQRNSLAASSPSLLRPRPQRLETIESIASTISRSETRSPPANVHLERNLRRGRSRSLGPDARIRRGEAKRGWFRRRRTKTPGPSRAHVEHGGDTTNDIWMNSAAAGDDRASKCRMM